MRGINDLSKRLNYFGGSNQEKRMNVDKVRGLKRALLYSYQAQTAEIVDGRHFRCLINPDRITNNFDEKEISIPFEDICLNKPRVGKTSEGQESIDIKAGDVIKWVENDTYWLVYLQRLEETAYFRAALRKCLYEIELDNGSKYRVYIRGPLDTTIQWFTKSKIYYNDLNYHLEMYITENEETTEYFHRFSRIRINGNVWETQVVNDESLEGVIKIALKEYYNNTIQDQRDEEIASIEIKQDEEKILGPQEVYPYDIIEYTLIEDSEGAWSVNNKNAKIIGIEGNKVILEITTGRSGAVELMFKKTDGSIIIKDISIKSL